jgi:cytochrome c-type protein NapC
MLIRHNTVKSLPSIAQEGWDKTPDSKSIEPMNFNIRVTTGRVIVFAVVAIIVGGFVFPFLAWLVADEGIAATSGSEFCVSCHTMEPMELAYLDDVHGGNSVTGVQVLCVDCHLDHESSTAYFFDKIQTGTHDMWVEYTQDTTQIDWEEKRLHRESYVYDTGCLHCHSRLEESTMANNKAFVAHKPYFLGDTSKQCVSCHEHVGHKNLSEYLAVAKAAQVQE